MQAPALESEAEKLLGDLIKALYMSQDGDLVSALVISLGLLLRARPTFSQLIVTSLITWDPANNLIKASPLQVRSVEKTIRITLAYLLRCARPLGSALSSSPRRTGQAGPYNAQITGFLHAQSGRMQKAAESAQRQRDDEASRKRSHIAEVVEQQASSKRRRLASSQTSFADAAAPVAAADHTADAAASFDVTVLPVHVVIELIIANLQAVPAARLTHAIEVSASICCFGRC
jgi:symplekin